MFGGISFVLLLIGIDSALGFRGVAPRSRHGSVCQAKKKSGSTSSKGFKPVAPAPPVPTVLDTPQDSGLLDLVPGTGSSTSINVEGSSNVESSKGFGKREAAAMALRASANETDVDEQIKKSKMYQTISARRLSELDDKIRKLKEEEALIASDPSVGAVPELVANRMIRRIGFFFGVPVFGGLCIFVAAVFVSKKYDIVIPPYVMAYATQIPFVVGLAGITYAILSSSWDDQPGWLLGLQEFKTNFGRIKEGLSRTRSTAELRDEIENEKQRLGRR